MKILYIFGDDYALLKWEDLDATNKSKITNNLKTNDEYEFEEGYFVKMLEFGEVDIEFLKFMESKIIDYDTTKHNYFKLLGVQI